MLILAVVLLTGTSVLATDSISINDLVENSVENDGLTVTVQGEAIGEILERGDHAWVNLLDGGNAIGIWMAIETANEIKYFGDHKNIGDTLRITGVFSRNCPEHGGDIDIHCSNMHIASVGHHITEIIDPSKVAVAIILVVVSATAIYYYFKRLIKEHK